MFYSRHVSCICHHAKSNSNTGLSLPVAEGLLVTQLCEMPKIQLNVRSDNSRAGGGGGICFHCGRSGKPSEHCFYRRTRQGAFQHPHLQAGVRHTGSVRLWPGRRNLAGPEQQVGGLGNSGLTLGDRAPLRLSGETWPFWKARGLWVRPDGVQPRDDTLWKLREHAEKFGEAATWMRPEVRLDLTGFAGAGSLGQTFLPRGWSCCPGPQVMC